MQPTHKYIGKVLRRTFLYVYAEQGEYILLGSRNLGQGGDILVYNPADFGVPGDETVPDVADFACSSNSPPDGSFGGVGKGVIASRSAELAGPNSADDSAKVANGFAPCAYKAPQAGLYGVIFTAADTGGNPNGSVAVPAVSNNSVSAWDVTVRSGPGSLHDLDGRLFTYAWIGFTGGNNRPDYAVHYYVTQDGYRYAQDLRGLDPNGYALYANSFGFLDNGQPLYKDIRGSEELVTSVPPGVTTQVAQYPSFFSDVTPGGPNEAEVGRVLAALGIAASPRAPGVSNLRFEGHMGGSVTTPGAGGTFLFDKTDTLSYEIVISRDGADFNPAAPGNRVLTGLAGSGTHRIAWDGKDNGGFNFPAATGAYAFRVRGHNGNIHFPIIDAENNPGRGPTITRLNGVGSPDTRVFYDDRGYRTAAGVLVGQLNGTLCGADRPSGPTVPVNLTGVDSASPYRDWISGRNANTDCARDAGWGDTKGLNLWTYFSTADVQGNLAIREIAVDAATTVTAPDVVPAGTLVRGSFSFSNNGTSAAQGVIYAMSMPPGLGTVLFGNLPAGAAATYDNASGDVRLSGLPDALAPGQGITYISFGYTAPAAGRVTVRTSITAGGDAFPENNTASASTGIGGSDVLTAVSVPASASAGALVNGTISFANNGGSAAEGVTYSALFGNEGNRPGAVDFTALPSGVSAHYDGASGRVRLANLPSALASGQAFNIAFQYVAPASGTLPVSTAIATTSPEADVSNNSARGETAVTEGSDMGIAFSDLPAAVAPGAVVDGLIVCRNEVGGEALNATCTVSTGGLSDCSQVPAAAAVPVPVNVARLPAGAGVVCHLSITAPDRGIVTVSGNTGADNDRHADNNAATPAGIPVIDAVDDGPVVLGLGGGPVPLLVNDLLGENPVIFGGEGANIGAPVIVDAGGLTGLAMDSVGRLAVPAGSLPGRYAVIYRICAAPNACDSAVASVVIGPGGELPQGPLANNDSAVTALNTPVTVPAAANDRAGPGQTLDPTSIDLHPGAPGQQKSQTVAGQGTFSVEAAGSVLFTPVAGFAGTVTISYTVADTARRTSNSANLSVTVNDSGASALPIANDDFAVTLPATPVAVPASGNDAPATGHALLPASLALIDPLDGRPKLLVSTPQGVWQAGGAAAGTVQFTPAAGFSGTAVIDYTIGDDSGAISEPAAIMVTVTGGAVRALDDSGATRPVTAVSLSVLDNDSAPAGQLAPETVDLVPGTSDTRESRLDAPEGAWSSDAAGVLTFLPAADYQGSGRAFTGPATVSYTVRDGEGRLSNAATVTVVVNPSALNAVDDSVVTPAEVPVVLRPSANDVASPGAVINASTVDLVPDTAGTVERGPISTPEGIWEIVDNAGSVRFTPRPGVIGVASLIYRISDSLGNTGTATLVVTVAPVQAVLAAPDAVDQLVTTPMNTPVTGSVTSQGTVPPGSAVALNSNPAHGTVALETNGAFSYVPSENYSGKDEFTYRLCLPAPDQAICDTATVTVQIGSGEPQRPLSLALTASRKFVRCGRAVQLSVRGGSGRGALRFSVAAEGAVQCRIVKSRGKRYLKATGTPPGTCTVTVTKAADKSHEAVTSNVITVKVR